MSDGAPIIVKKKKVVAGGHHGGAWKVAYADFVTAMMAFFMVMWIMGMDPSTKSMIAGYFNDPFGVLKSPPKTNSAFSLPGSPKPKEVKGEGGSGESQADRGRDKRDLEKIKEELQERLESQSKVDTPAEFKALLDHVNVTVTDEGLRLEFSEAAGSVFFLSGDWKIRPQAEALIAVVAPALTQSRRSIIVEGHTDARPFGSAGYTNWDLSAERALEMRRVLSRYGVPMSQFVEVRGYADQKLKAPNDPYNFANRRVTVLLPFRTAGRSDIDLPTGSLKDEVEGAFREPTNLSPGLAPPKVD